MRLYRFLALTALLAMAGTACADLEVTNLNDPDRARAISTPNDVESLISGAYSSVWSTIHYSYPGSALSTAADAHSSSWGNWGMRDFGWEPRKEYDNDPAYSYSAVAEVPWSDLYGALAAVRDGFIAIDGGISIGQGGADNPRAMAFGKFVQGLSMAYIGLLFDKGFIVDENTDLESLSFVPYQDVFDAGIAKLNEAEQMAKANSFIIPPEWIGFDAEFTSAKFARWVSSWRARVLSEVARSKADRDAADWNKILSDVQNGLGPDEDYATYDDGNNWAWARDKLHTAAIAGWARLDIRTYGPADQSGKFQEWLALPPDDRRPFDVVTPDRRITGDTPETDGTLVAYIGSSPFPANRGYYHYSNYLDVRWNYYSSGFIGRLPEWTPIERDLLMAEAMYRTGDKAGAMALVNEHRANGDLPAFTDVNGTAPGTDCVPRTADGSCGDLWEALKYEKRIELFHYGPFIEYFDDRGWGDLVKDTPTQLPIPGSELLLLLEDIYTFGGPGGNSSAPSLIADFSPEGLHAKRVAFERFRQAQRDADAKTGTIAN